MQWCQCRHVAFPLFYTVSLWHSLFLCFASNLQHVLIWNYHLCSSALKYMIFYFIRCTVCNTKFIFYKLRTIPPFCSGLYICSCFLYISELQCFRIRFSTIQYTVTQKRCRPRCQVVIILASRSEVRGFDGFFSERKNPEYVFLRKESKSVGPVS